MRQTRLIALIVVVVAIPFLYLIGMNAYTNHVQEEKYNNGICHCGGHLVYEEALAHRAYTTYIFKCDKCGELSEYNQSAIEGHKIYHKEDLEQLSREASNEEQKEEEIEDDNIVLQ